MMRDTQENLGHQSLIMLDLADLKFDIFNISVYLFELLK